MSAPRTTRSPGSSIPQKTVGRSIGKLQASQILRTLPTPCTVKIPTCHLERSNRWIGQFRVPMLKSHVMLPEMALCFTMMCFPHITRPCLLYTSDAADDLLCVD